MTTFDWIRLLKETNADTLTIDSSDSFIEKNDDRNTFKRDFDQIVSWSSFRRLQDKAQVFPLEINDFTRTRLTHSIEVLSIAESFGNHLISTIIDKELSKLKNIKVIDIKYPFLYLNKELYRSIQNIPQILRSAALLHDLGNPPFGHVSEQTISKWFKNNLKQFVFDEETFTVDKVPVNVKTKKQRLTTILKNYAEDFYNFDGNAQILRIVRKLQNLSPRVDARPVKISFPTISATIKYPHNHVKTLYKDDEKKKNKRNYFNGEKGYYESIQKLLGTNGYRHPLAFLIEAADDIAYLSSDLEDALNKNLFDIIDLIDLLKFNKIDENSRIYKLFDNETRKELLSIYDEGTLIDLVKSIETYVSSESENVAIKKTCSRLRGFFIARVKEEISKRYDDIMNHSYYANLLETSSAIFLSKALRKMSYEKVYYSTEIVKKKAEGINCINIMLDNFVPSIINSYNKEATDSKEFVVTKLISQNFYELCCKRIEKKDLKDKLYELIFLAIDYIAGMTDSYAETIASILNK